MFITFGFTGVFYLRAQILFNLTLMSSFDLIIVQPIHHRGNLEEKKISTGQIIDWLIPSVSSWCHLDV
jgi:hypothetical protein